MKILDTPQAMATYITDNAILQEFLTQFLQLKEEDQRDSFEKLFWEKLKTEAPEVQAEVKKAYSKLAQRLYDRMGSILQYYKNEFVVEPV